MRKKIITIVCIVFLLCSSSIYGKEYKVSIKKLPGIEDELVNLVRSVIEATGNTAVIEIAPPGKSEFLINNNKVDIEYPAIYIAELKKGVNLEYDYSSSKVGKISFVFYSNKDNPVDIESVKKDRLRKFNIETEPSLYGKFDYNFIQTTNINASLKKLSLGKIDGFITVQATGDIFLKKSGLKNIKRQLWYEYPWTFAIKKGAKGGEIDKMLSEGIRILKEQGKLDGLIGLKDNETSYDDWQP